MGVTDRTDTAANWRYGARQPMHGQAVIAALLTGLALAAAGCGGSDDTDTSGAATSPQPTIRNPHPWTEQQVMDAAGLTTEDDGLSYQTASGCNVSVVLTSANAVETYAGAGSTVVTNPAGTAGVKTSGDDPKCLRELQRGLALLK